MALLISKRVISKKCWRNRKSMNVLISSVILRSLTFLSRVDARNNYRNFLKSSKIKNFDTNFTNFTNSNFKKFVKLVKFVSKGFSVLTLRRLCEKQLQGFLKVVNSVAEGVFAPTGAG
jgi:hypothetical protein